MAARLRSWFLTGLAALLPLIVTLMVISFLFRAVGGPLGSLFVGEAEGARGFLASVAGFLATMLLITLVGFVTRYVFGQQMVKAVEAIVHRMPLLRSIYMPTSQLVEFLFSNKTQAFKRVVIVEYPRQGVYTIGFLTGDCVGEFQHRREETMINVFLPTTPNPTSGWLAIVPLKDVTMLDMSVEEGLRLIVSGGVLTPSWQPEEEVQSAAGYEPSTLTNKA